ncbi:hypothetical protein TorRG33x02_151600 [Trema orientale]|uniref:Uncharacterized protein n=1 Tax=Trema orientale TaxID=63057 RepID=A0A2P5EU96_TREOI|nr:hypothetical protein TorRG33x02_151600 [Trema orientale]
MYHLLIKFPTEKGVGVVHGGQARACYATSASLPKASEDLSMSQPLECNMVYHVEDIELLDPGNLRVLGELNPTNHECRRVIEPVEPLRPYRLAPERPRREVHLGSKVIPKQRAKLEHFLIEYKDIFAWSHKDMPGIDPEAIVHKLNVDLDIKPVT